MMNILELKNLNKSYSNGDERLEIIRDMNFSLEPGRQLIITGESGCGKSVTCMSLSRLLPEVAEIQKGSIELKTRSGETVDILSLEPRSLRKIRGGEIGYIFQDFKLINEMTVADNIGILRLEGIGISGMDEMLEALDMLENDES